MQINRMEEAASKSTQPNKQNSQLKAASLMPRFPPISSSFPTSIFSPPVNPLVRQNELQTVELNEMKTKIIELEEKRDDEKTVEINGLTSQIVTLQNTLVIVEKELVEKKVEESIYFQELNNRLSNMEKQINAFIIENKELKEALSNAESEVRLFSQRESERVMMEGQRIAETLKVVECIMLFRTFFFHPFFKFVAKLSHQLLYFISSICVNIFLYRSSPPRKAMRTSRKPFY